MYNPLFEYYLAHQAGAISRPGCLGNKARLLNGDAICIYA